MAAITNRWQDKIISAAEGTEASVKGACCCQPGEAGILPQVCLTSKLMLNSHASEPLLSRFNLCFFFPSITSVYYFPKTHIGEKNILLKWYKETEELPSPQAWHLPQSAPLPEQFLWYNGWTSTGTSLPKSTVYSALLMLYVLSLGKCILTHTHHYGVTQSVSLS